ncbi:thrombopoietin receptor isoform X5 [Poecile atricapillus]|uniref:thrombopoietin receptor isoform X5 n=1 Tax=Poecile atricapillus TaxID=48891 RepID=UPI0027393B3F|nr:thrombopoietin receptor isoform X5 [Poecile atricapillus]
MGRGEPPARLPELHSHHFPDKGIAQRSRSSSQDTGKGRVRHVWLQHMGCRMAACLCQSWQLSLLPAILLSLRSPPSAPEPVTSQDAALLAGLSEDILCFSRSFEDLTCFWDEEETTGMCHFYYWYSRDAPTACMVSTWHHGTGGKRHVCVFPSQDVRLFTQLHLRVLDATTNYTKYWRELSVDAVGLIAPPANITARWAGAAGQICVSWQPPLADFLNFFLYEVQCCPASSPGMPCNTTLNPGGQHPGDPSIESTVSTHTPRAGEASPGVGQRLVQANTWVVLRDLQPGVRYHIQVRSKPDGTSMDGVWGPWSQAVAAETPHSSGDIGLCCSTPDLRHVHCEWSWDPAETHSSHQLFYRPPPNGAGTREDAWQQCGEVSRGAQSTHACTFQPKAGSAISVLVNVTRTHMLPTLSYFKEPFWLHQAGWLIPSVAVVLLLFSAVLLGLRCTFPSLYSNVKEKLWPPVPDLHRALGNFLQESSKHGQVRGWSRAAQLTPGAARRAAPTTSTACPPRTAPSTSSRRRRPSCPAYWRCCPARGARRARHRSTLGAACPARTSPTSPTCS